MMLERVNLQLVDSSGTDHPRMFIGEIVTALGK